MAAPTAWPIQFASGAKPGVKRKISKTKTEVETKEKRKKYEKDKRPARTFNIKWKEGRDWLVFDISSCLTLFSDNQGFILCIIFLGGILFLKEVRILIFCILRRHRICIFCPILMFFSL
jgi:hypothetical protein